MYIIRLQWKEFNVSLANLEDHLRANYSTYVGSNANSVLDLGFSEEPSQEEKDGIMDHWESLDGSDYKTIEEVVAEENELKEAINTAKAGLISKSWDEMSETERKIVMNMEVTRAEMGLE
jgi:hypothetical protein